MAAMKAIVLGLSGTLVVGTMWLLRGRLRKDAEVRKPNALSIPKEDPPVQLNVFEASCSQDPLEHLEAPTTSSSTTSTPTQPLLASALHVEGSAVETADRSINVDVTLSDTSHVQLGTSAEFFDAPDHLSSRESIIELGSPQSDTQSMLDDWEVFRTSLGLTGSRSLEENFHDSLRGLENVVETGNHLEGESYHEHSTGYGAFANDMPTPETTEEGAYDLDLDLDLDMDMELTEAEREEVQMEVDRVLQNLRNRRREVPQVQRWLVDETGSYEDSDSESFYGANFPEGPEFEGFYIEVEESQLEALREALRKAPLVGSPDPGQREHDFEDEEDLERLYAQELEGVSDWRVLNEPMEEESEPLDLNRLVLEMEEEMENERLAALE